ncbi:MAG TPA: hypothetical protein VLN61_00565 [Pseudolabrys sp.]|nr:hypothetical protein [Pseudolabrys sp.]
MRRMHRIVLLVGLIVLAPVLAGCEDFDMDKFDFLHLNEKKKLPGERKDVFPQGVPGVSQGIPPEYMKGNQPQPETAQAPAAEPAAPAPSAKTAAIEPAAELKPKPRRKPKPRTATHKPTQITVQPAAQGQASGQQQMSPTPGTPPQQPASGQSTSTDPWPSAPAPGTFSR